MRATHKKSQEGEFRLPTTLCYRLRRRGLIDLPISALIINAVDIPFSTTYDFVPETIAGLDHSWVRQQYNTEGLSYPHRTPVDQASVFISGRYLFILHLQLASILFTSAFQPLLQ